MTAVSNMSILEVLVEASLDALERGEFGAAEWLSEAANNSEEVERRYAHNLRRAVFGVGEEEDTGLGE